MDQRVENDLPQKLRRASRPGECDPERRRHQRCDEATRSESRIAVHSVGEISNMSA